jgi:uncharacterized protein with HEPN domain
MSKDDLVRLRHMLDAAREAIGFVAERSRADLDADRQLVLALVKAVEIVGEAAYQLSPQTRQDLPQLPWEDIIGMRHRLVHAYFDINLEVLWRTAKDDLPALVAALAPKVEPAIP